MMLFSAEPARKYFTGRSVSVHRYVASADSTDQRLRIADVNSSYPAHRQVILAFEDAPFWVELGWWYIGFQGRLSPKETLNWLGWEAISAIFGRLALN